MKDNGPFREGAVHVRRQMCQTCIFRPGNLMRLRRGRVAEMKRGADEAGTCITCHEDMDTPKAAVCAGYYARVPFTGKGEDPKEWPEEIRCQQMPEGFQIKPKAK